ncbi:MAG: rhodanese-like domain-containing protein [Pseudomonadota bacterium]
MTDRSSPIPTTPAPGYAGDVEPTDTWAALEADPAARLVDVRTKAEWQFTGTADLAALGNETRLIEWQSYPDGRPNATFVETLREAVPETGAPVFFLCRTGARSAAAARAATEAGYSAAYNVADGYEGPADAQGRRSRIAGWRASDLDWSQP